MKRKIENSTYVVCTVFLFSLHTDISFWFHLAFICGLAFRMEAARFRKPDAYCKLKIAYMEFQDVAKQKIQRIKNRPHPNWEHMSFHTAINEIRWIWDMLIAVVNCAKYSDNSQNIISSAVKLCDDRLVGMPDTPMSREVREMLDELKKVKSLND